MSGKVAMTDTPIKYPWWYGGAGGIFACIVTHPLDLAKVRLQTASPPKPTLLNMIRRILQQEGPRGLYAGLSASVLRQCTYTTARFGCYDIIKENLIPQSEINNSLYLLPCSMLSGAIGGFVGNPADVVNIRMQNDSAHDPHLRRGYRNAFDGLNSIVREEGFYKLFTGLAPNLIRGVLMTASQVVSYDVFKHRWDLLCLERYVFNTTFCALCSTSFITRFLSILLYFSLFLAMFQLY
ncbi:hypothetical protein HG536_0B00200 [Torulaspora globosa]|uniref:Mitochondrial dicarboxylate carrier n=1 Tax=Torulaspora globosa TaxID=48254 RepID=A0A7G3ZCC3_9SACH|nr:uncharacterized protein HG536_0B00200 [Torulaspora globosa]QLL31159.1 hypothetical protein HG536_0B00200 [Torulaspora globosa]